jgi:hypothetical protein
MQYPSGVSQRTWSATAPEVITAGLLRQNVTAPLWLISSPPMAILAQQVTPTSISSGAYLTVNPLDTEILDTGMGHSDAVNPFRCYAGTSGWWLIRGAVPFAAATTNTAWSFGAGLLASHSGTSTAYAGARHPGPSSATAAAMPAVAELLPLAAKSPVTSGDFFQLQGFQDTGSPVSTLIGTSAGVFPWIAGRWCGTLTGTAPLPVPPLVPFSDATEITGAFMNTNVRDAVNFLSFPPMCRLSNQGGSAQSAVNGTSTAVQFAGSAITGLTSDNYGGWSAGNPTRYTFPVAGRWYVAGQAAFASSNSGICQSGLRVNGGTTSWGTKAAAPATSTAGVIAASEQYLRVSAGDYVQLIAFQSSGGSLSLTTSPPSYSKLIALWTGV